MKNINRRWIQLGQIMSIITLALLVGASQFEDPTRPPDAILAPTTETNTQPLALTAIFIYPNYRIAIINNQIVTIGDHLGEYIITAITPLAVELKGPLDNKEILPLVLPVKQER